MLKSLYDNSIKIDHEQTTPPEPTLIYHITLIKMNDDFKRRLIEAYIKNSQWIKVFNLLKLDKNENEPKLFIEFRFRKHNDLIYIITLDHVGKNRFYIF